MPVLFCNACGAIASARAVKLRDPVCKPQFSPDLRKLRRGILPGGGMMELETREQMEYISLQLQLLEMQMGQQFTWWAGGSDLGR